jgi:hypothetical protein
MYFSVNNSDKYNSLKVIPCIFSILYILFSEYKNIGNKSFNLFGIFL